MAAKPWTELNGFYNTCTRFDSDRRSSRFAWLKWFDTLIYLNTVVDDEDRSIHHFAASSAELWDHDPVVLGFDVQGRLVRVETQGSVTQAAFRDPAATGRTDISYKLVGGPIHLPAEETIHRYP